MLNEIQEENTNLFGFRGVIGRRNFFFNEVIIFFITLPFILPYIIHYFSLTEYSESYQIFCECPLLMNLCSVIVILGTTILNISNIWRRYKDVCWDFATPLKVIAGIFGLTCLPMSSCLVSANLDAVFLVGTLPYLAMHIVLFFLEGQQLSEECKITERREFIWLYKRRKQLLLIYPVICILLTCMLFIGHKTPDTSQIYPELENQEQTIFTLETKNR